MLMFHVGNISAQMIPSKGRLKLKDTTSHIEFLSREPMLVQHPDGTLFTTGYTNSRAIPDVWKSSDLGSIWEKINGGSMETGAGGNSDKDLAIDEKGNVFVASMEFGPLESDSSVWAGKYIVLGISKDKGASWEWKYVSREIGDDRPWITTSPGKVHLVWNNKRGVFYRVSKDEGASWSNPVQIIESGCSSHFAVSQSGILAVRITPHYQSSFLFDTDADFIALSRDGKNWSLKKPPGDAQWSHSYFSPDSIPRWVEPIAWDKNENLYSVWSEGRQVFIGRTANLADSWDSWLIADGKLAFYPYLAADTQAKRLVASWFTYTDIDRRKVRGNVAFIDFENSNSPRLLISHPLELDIWRRRGGFSDTGGEYFPVVILQDGNIGAITTVQNHAKQRFGFKWWRWELKR